MGRAPNDQPLRGPYVKAVLAIFGAIFLAALFGVGQEPLAVAPEPTADERLWSSWSSLTEREMSYMCTRGAMDDYADLGQQISGEYVTPVEAQDFLIVRCYERRTPGL